MASSLGLSTINQDFPLGITNTVANGTVFQSNSIGGQTASHAFTTARTQTQISSDSLDVEIIDQGGNWMYYQLDMYAAYISTFFGPNIYPIGDFDFGFHAFLDPSNPDYNTNPELLGSTMEGVTVGPLSNGTTALTVNNPGGSGSFTTRTYDLFQSSALPGAVMILGPSTALNVSTSPNVLVSTSARSASGTSTSPPSPEPPRCRSKRSLRPAPCSMPSSTSSRTARLYPPSAVPSAPGSSRRPG